MNPVSQILFSRDAEVGDITQILYHNIFKNSKFACSAKPAHSGTTPLTI